MSAGALWRHRDFVRLWSAQTISELGSQITVLALPLTAISALHASAFAVAALAATGFAPFLIVSIPAGVWVDRLRRRPIMLNANIARAALLGSVPAAYLAGVLTLSQLYLVAFVTGTFNVFFSLAYAAYVPDLLDRDRLVEANAKLQASTSVAQLGGPGVGGLLVAATSAPTAIVADALSFVASAFLISSIAHREPPHERRSDEAKAHWRGELGLGARYALGNRYVRPVLIASAVANFGLNMIWGILLVYCVRVLALAPGLTGLILSVGEGGGLLGAVVGHRVQRAAGVGRTMIASAALFGVGGILIALAPARFAIPFLTIGWGVGSFSAVIFSVIGVSLRQAIVPQQLQARVVGFNRFFVLGTIPLGSLAGGAFATAIGLRQAIAVGATIAGCAFIAVLLSPLRHLRDLPQEDENTVIRPPTVAASQDGS